MSRVTTYSPHLFLKALHEQLLTRIALDRRRNRRLRAYALRELRRMFGITSRHLSAIEHAHLSRHVAGAREGRFVFSTLSPVLYLESTREQGLRRVVSNPRTTSEAKRRALEALMRDFDYDSSSLKALACASGS